jgi:ribosomal protein L7/L12
VTETVILSALVGVGVALLLQRLAVLERRLDRLSRLDAKVDVLLQHAGVTFDEFHDVPADVREAIERGAYIVAIKRLRQATGVGLKEAKDIVDDVKRRGPASRAVDVGHQA